MSDYILGEMPALFDRETGELKGYLTPTGQEKPFAISATAAAAGAAVASAFSSLTVIGDSIAAYGDGVKSGGTLVGPTSQSIPAWAFSQIDGTPFNISANRAAGGKTIDLVVTEQLPAALADNSDILWVHAGINNLNPAIDASAPTVAQIIARMRRLLDMAATKPVVILDALTPLAAASISGALPRRTDIPLVNAGYKELAAQYRNVFFNDVYTPLAQDATSGLAKPGVTVANDGIHLTTYGAHLAGLASVATLSQIAMRPRYRTTNVFVLPGISGSGGTKTAGAGTINGEVADNCNVAIASNAAGVTVTASVGVGRPNSQRLRIQNSAGNTGSSVVRFQLASFTDYLTGLASGEVVRATGRIAVQSSAGLYRHDLSIQQDPSGTVVNFPSMQKSTAEDGNGDSFPTFPPGPYTVKLTATGALTATPASINVAFSIEVAPGGDVTVDISGWTFEEVLLA